MSKKILVDILDIKPIIAVRNTGIVEVVGGVRGGKKALKNIVDRVCEIRNDFSNTIVAIGYTGDPDIAEDLKKSLAEKSPNK